MKLGVIADVHGNDLALRAVLDDAARYHVDHWWVLGDLVLFGPRPAEALDRLRGLPGVSMLRGSSTACPTTSMPWSAICTAAVIPAPPSSGPSSPANTTSGGPARRPGCPSCG